MVFYRLLHALQQPKLNMDVKPLIINSFSEICIAIGQYYEKYLDVTLQILQFASQTQVDTSNEDLVYYLTTLREAILETYDAIIQSLGKERISILKEENLSFLLKFMNHLWHEKELRTSTVVHFIISIIGDLTDALGKQTIVCLDRDCPSYKEIIEHGIRYSKNIKNKKAAEFTNRKLQECTK